MKLLKLVTEENEKFEQGIQDSKYKGFIEKFKIDFLAQLIFENNYKLYPYTGISSFIKISSNNPRAFLVILKEVFERSKLNHENPFEDKHLIKVKTQSLGIFQASKWFYEDTEAYGEDGKMLYRCINNLAELLQGIRYSDKPSETSPSSFSYKHEKPSSEADKFIELAEIHRIILPVKGRHDKNSERVDKSYQLNRMLAPYFNLPISRRGIVPLNDNLIEAIFNPMKHGEFQKLYNDFVSNLNAPFGDAVQQSIF